jgi:hypothetical protein
VPKITRVPVTAPVLVFVEGQLWKFGARCIQIRHVGKLLVSHRNVALDNKPARSRIQMLSIKELREFLVAERAVLVPEATS